jgi:1,4-dihydroxy-2-naphthoate octaprenyltransferase
MSQEFVTLTRQDPEFESYLLGTFSKTERALPVETYHPHTQRERVTFRVVSVADLQVPRWWVVYFRSIRPELAALTLAPAIAAWLNHRADLPDWTRWPSWFALAGIFFLHTAVFLYTDVQDHLLGEDRLNRRRGNQVIQKGWVSAWQMRLWALLNFALAIVFGVPAFANAPLELLVICGTAALLIAVVARKWAVRWGLCDLALAMLFGPLLSAGVALSSFGHLTTGDLLLGVLFGCTTLWVFQLRQFESLFRSQAQAFRTLLGFLSFEQARSWCVGEGILLLIMHPLLALWFGQKALLYAMPVVAIPTLVLIQKLRTSASPLSSTLVNISRFALYAQLCWALWWIVYLGLEWLL